MGLQLLKRENEPVWPVVLMDFAYIGATCFGGGSATVAAMRRLCLRRGWLNEAEFMDVLVLSRITPGISILAQVLLIGRAACGIPGMVAGMAGLLAPSIAITVALAWLYDLLSKLPGTDGPLHAIAAVAAGFAAAMALQFVRDILLRSRFRLNAAIFAAYLGLSCVIADPLIVMALAVAFALAVPALYDPGEAKPKGGKTVDGDGV